MTGRPRRPIVAGNWKMHKGPSEARAFVEAFADAHPPREEISVALFPPAISLAAARGAAADRPDLLFGVQNLYWEEAGAFTGETSAPMAADAGAALALAGHSERRHLFGETSEAAARKVRAALDAGLAPVLCVGETIEERRAGRAEATVGAQLSPVLAALSAEEAERMVVAYEPVWAIGTGETASPADAREMHRAIRRRWAEAFGAASADALPVLYGGSVKPGNAAELMAEPGVDGVLVGGASLDPGGFARIAAAAIRRA